MFPTFFIGRLFPLSFDWVVVLCSFCSKLGAPTEHTWPGVTSLPEYPKTLGFRTVLFRRHVLGDHPEPVLSDLVNVCCERRMIRE
jgi:hypothetical protein